MTRPAPKSTLFPYTTLFRSPLAVRLGAGRHVLLPERVLGKPQRGREGRSEEHTSELQSRLHLVCRLLLEKKKMIFPCICLSQTTYINSTEKLMFRDEDVFVP